MRILVFILIFLLTACPQKEEQKQQEQPEKIETPIANVELQPAGFDELAGWKSDDLSEMAQSIESNCQRVMKVDGDWLGNSIVKVDAKLYKNICNVFLGREFSNTQELRSFIEENFVPFLVLDGGESQGKFTSYYESQINASFQKSEKYRFPVYGKPNDMFEINLRDFDENLPQKRLVGRIDGKKMVPYFERAYIENEGIDAPVLMWADSLVDVHIMQIQGSAVAQMDNGAKIRVGYAENNGLPFKGIGSVLLEKKVLQPGKANMIEIKKWLKENPEKAKEFMQENRRYIFHRIINESGPMGAWGVPLQAGRSMAVDREFIPLGSMLWLETVAPDGTPINKLVLAQDIGSAIKGAVRGDYFWGSGGDEVLAIAGSMNSAGRYYILLPKGQSDGLD
ncbi:MAG: murein transglycosylase A [Alphaproteobacteria bacterium]|nr:murein transglycosylase A [Alphaproteobacteria bacterium]